MKLNQSIATLVAAAGLCWGTASVQALPSISLNVLDPAIAVGQTFNVQVVANSGGLGEELLAFSFYVDPGATLANVVYNGASVNALFNDDSLGGNHVAGSAFPGVVTDPVVLATLSFTASALGPDVLTIQGLLNNFDGLYYETAAIDIDASEDIEITAAAVPDSASIWMALTTLTGLCAFRLRRK